MTHRTLALATLVLLVGTTLVSAQRPGIGSYQNPAAIGRPTVSPYLNLLRRGSPTLNYYGLVRPQTQLRQGQVELYGDYRELRREFRENPALGIDNSTLGPTGHTSYFRNEFRGSLSRLDAEMARRRETTRLLGPIRGSHLGTTGHHVMSGPDPLHTGRLR